MEVKTILQRFDDIAEELKRLEAELVKAITEAVKEISEENPHNINKIAPNCYVIKASQLIGNPWNPSYYDWEASGKVVLDYLQKKDVKKWKAILQEKLDKSNDNSIDFEIDKLLQFPNFQKKLLIQMVIHIFLIMKEQK